MSTLLLKFAAPIQSCGSPDSKYTTRNTLLYPTKSEIIGLLASALGRSREDDVTDLASMNVGVRIDSQGSLMRDYQTIRTRRYDKSTGTYRFENASAKTAYIAEKHYLTDAVFVVAVNGDDALVGKCSKALDYPEFPLFLGRRACPPTDRLLIGVVPDNDIVRVLRNAPFEGRTPDFRKRQSEYLALDAYLDANAVDTSEAMRQENENDNNSNDSENYIIDDVPVSFSQRRRSFSKRAVRHLVLSVTNPFFDEATADPMRLL